VAFTFRAIGRPDDRDRPGASTRAAVISDGFGAVGGGANARGEHAMVPGMVERATLAAALLTSLSAP
jgi:hypothetical protein